MEKKLTKVIIDGKEFQVTDKQAQQMLDILSNDVEQLKKDVDELNNCLTWRIIE
ncbi:hypothetical protein [Phocaeicola massiliensis]|uniref:hypothetical protein n=1 Tax=Phocaeicola massiliensis TaxID=204516 RepID=UPI0032C0CB35